MKLPTIKLQGKEYAQVKDRLSYFRENYKDYSLKSDLKISDGYFIVSTVILDDKDRCVATGLGAEKIGGQKALEKAETHSWGRALANLGLGIDGSIASYEEMEDVENPQAEAFKKEVIDQPPKNAAVIWGKEHAPIIRQIADSLLLKAVEEGVLIERRELSDDEKKRLVTTIKVRIASPPQNDTEVESAIQAMNKFYTKEMLSRLLGVL